ncbi:DUF3035 domain-containing protein [Roseicyclus persicicus]|uniref:DUF3035 domain-containing protein n=1 Tax=Roseicyclus persicicus TaxID=2650661 RepID=A0A7X6H026_9RHOB|nr:DUF3035 domain-containing protein [Roseibacterium persicicum]NKX45549.1 DUF3035 domain-containing protein [Roseibacterium persicicum]
MPRLFTTLTLAAATVALAACGSGDPRLMNLRNTESGPDEFSVLPTEPIAIPADLRTLPPPTPGGTNRTDPDPEGDAIRALGGNPERATSQAGDIVGYASRFGTSPDIRGVLAAEDLEYRRDNNGRLLERLFGNNVYFRAYRSMWLDRYAELERLRRAGVRTPAAPPEGIVLE